MNVKPRRRVRKGAATYKVLIIDDDDLNLKFMASMLQAQGYAVETAANGAEGLEKATLFRPDAVLLDVMMPELDGYEVLRRLKALDEIRHVPVILVTALNDRESKLTGFKAGASEFLSKPVDRVELTLRIQSLVKGKEYSDFLLDHNRTLEHLVQQRTLQLETAYIEISEANERIKSAYLDTIYRLTMAAEYRDEDTASHLKRMSFYSRLISRELGMHEDFVDTIFYASPMHDIGKIGIPDVVLLKPDRLSPEEFELAKAHTTIGGKILHGSESGILQMAEKIAMSHHERWDGSGYPSGLRGRDIPIEGRIVSIVDQYDSLRSSRTYKPSFSHEEAIRIITEGDGRTVPGHFDPEILEVLKRKESELGSIYEGHT